ncbi:MAG TPA: MFS transporter, partial [Candidatus Nitrosotenuis sp.]|nr:MFS transporter [Candidatus Nitrosotenuis sp.]
LLNLVGQSIGPSLAAMYQQMHQATVEGVPGRFPTTEAYNSIFLMATLISMTAVALALALNRKKIAV